MVKVLADYLSESMSTSTHTFKTVPCSGKHLHDIYFCIQVGTGWTKKCHALTINHLKYMLFAINKRLQTGRIVAHHRPNEEQWQPTSSKTSTQTSGLSSSWAQSSSMNGLKWRGPTHKKHQLNEFNVGYIPNNPCMVYFPTFTIKINQM